LKRKLCSSTTPTAVSFKFSITRKERTVSIEAVALGRLITAVEELPPETIPHRITSAVNEAKYWLKPVQTFRDKLYDMWENNPHWTRPQFLDYIHADDMSGWALNCICVGDMNYRVENDGFIGWLKAEGHATERDFTTIVNLCRSLKTPVGYKVAALVSSVQVFLMGIRRDQSDENYQLFADDVGILSDEYLKLRYDFMTQMEQKLRQDVPVFHPVGRS